MMPPTVNIVASNVRSCREYPIGSVTAPDVSVAVFGAGGCVGNIAGHIAGPKNVASRDSRLDVRIYLGAVFASAPPWADP
jgi:hypothetical protein